jgi:hypothetical protein
MKEAFQSLEPSTRKWITRIKKQYALEDYHVRLFVLAGQAWDRAQQARRLIEVDGPIQRDRFGQSKAHPAVQVEVQSMLAFAKLLRETGIDLDKGETPRPPRQYGR